MVLSRFVSIADGWVVHATKALVEYSRLLQWYRTKVYIPVRTYVVGECNTYRGRGQIGEGEDGIIETYSA